MSRWHLIFKGSCNRGLQLSPAHIPPASGAYCGEVRFRVELQKAAFADARIIIVTNYDDTHFREAARQAGADGYILKENLLEVCRILQR